MSLLHFYEEKTNYIVLSSLHFTPGNSKSLIRFGIKLLSGVDAFLIVSSGILLDFNERHQLVLPKNLYLLIDINTK